MGHLFGTNGVRGLVNDTLTPELALRTATRVPISEPAYGPGDLAQQVGERLGITGDDFAVRPLVQRGRHGPRHREHGLPRADAERAVPEVVPEGRAGIAPQGDARAQLIHPT